MFIYRLLIFLLAFIIIPSFSAYASEAKKAVILVIDQVTLQDLNDADLPAIKQMIKEGGLALMNTNAIGGRTKENSYVTIGAGKVTMGSKDAGLAFNASESYEKEVTGKMFRRFTGQTVPSDTLIHLGIVSIKRNNNRKNYSGIPGLLGEELHRAGLKTAVIGNADINKSKRRNAVSIVMDMSGIVDNGMISEEILLIDDENNLLMSTDYNKMSNVFKEVIKYNDVIVLETGDISRIEEMKNLMEQKIINESKKMILTRIDAFAGDVLRIARTYNTLFLIITPTPSADANTAKNIVTPLIYWKNDMNSSLLTSGTTRRKGIVANTDIAPTILNYFDIPIPLEMSGRFMKSIETENTMESLLSQNNNMVFIYKARPLLVKGYIFMQIIVVITTVLALFTCQRRILKFFQPILLTLASIPLSFLIMGKVSGISFHLYSTLSLGIAMFVMLISLWGLLYHDLLPFMIITLLTAGAILIDLGLGAKLMQNSVLGYDPMAGARYYGLGNEYMGVLIGAVLISTASLLQISKRKNICIVISAMIYLITLYMIAAPGVGTNAGGAIAAATAFIFTFYNIIGREVKRREWIFVVVGATVILISFASFDSNQTIEVQSHFGRSINLIRTNGLWEAYSIIIRKASLNFKLIRWSIWGQVFLITLLATVLLFYRPVGLMRHVLEKYSYLTKGFWGVGLGSLIALVFNDSGIVAAATMSIFAAMPLMFVVIQEKECNRIESS